jgi:hypothetical protein
MSPLLECIGYSGVKLLLNNTIQEVNAMCSAIYNVVSFKLAKNEYRKTLPV